MFDNNSIESSDNYIDFEKIMKLSDKEKAQFLFNLKNEVELLRQEMNDLKKSQKVFD